MTEALRTYLGSRDRGEATSGPKLTSVPTVSSLGRPGSPPPELLTCEGTRIAESCKWHFGALTLPQKCQWHCPRKNQLFPRKWPFIQCFPTSPITKSEEPRAKRRAKMRVQPRHPFAITESSPDAHTHA